MPVTREQLEARESRTLAAYAQRSAETRGRRHAEPPPEWRTHFQRDRDRIIHSRSFRRLEYKTQVFLNGTGDHFRTRLTHTMEVAGIARNITRALGLNEDLTEAISLAHDLGHSAFGHRGEAVLDRMMRDHGGFEHNRQSLRIVEELEQKYPAFPGLNLTWEVREGLTKHGPPPGDPTDQYPVATPGSTSLEAQVANLADEIAYYSHDLDDGLGAGLVEESQILANSRLWAEAAARVEREAGVLDDERRRFFIIRCLIDSQVKDVVWTTEARIRDLAIGNPEDARRQIEPVVAYSDARRSSNLELREFLYANLYFNQAIHDPNQRAVQMLEVLFCYYLEHPQDLGELSQKRVAEVGLHRAVCDYLAGMTDRFAAREYQRLCTGQEAAPHC